MADTFSDLIARGADPKTIEAHLDALDPATRVVEVRATSGTLQEKVWRLVKGHAPARMEVFCGETDQTVIYSGKNSLPAFTIFEKRFWRRRDGRGIEGYNHQKMAAFTGPGYFTARDGDDGEIVFDYTQIPDLRPDGWPPIAPNTGLIGSVVYGNMIDYNRRISKTTYIGRAVKHGKPMNSYFLLTRS